MKYAMKFKYLSLRNFMSYGNNYTYLKLDNPGSTLIVGRNEDSIEGESSGNGCGKTSILNAITYCLYDETIERVNKDNLVNLTNKKNMEVVNIIEVNDRAYAIKRARKCRSGASGNFVLIYQSDKVYTDDEYLSTLNALQGNPTETQETTMRELGFKDITVDSIGNNAELLKSILLNIPFELFVRIVVFSANHKPFLDLPVRSANGENQSTFMEELFNLTILSEKADLLKEQIKNTEQNLKNYQQKIELIEGEHNRHNAQLESAKNRVSTWEDKQKTELVLTQHEIEKQNFENFEEFEALFNMIQTLNNKITTLSYEYAELNNTKTQLLIESNTIKKQLDNTKLKLEEWDCETKDDIESIKNQLKKIDVDNFDDLRELYKKSQELDTQLTKHKTTYTELNNNKKQLLTESKNNQDQIDKTKSRIFEWEDSHKQDIAVAKNQLEKIEIDNFDELQQLYADVQNLKSKISKDASELTAAIKDKEGIDKQLHKHKHELEDLADEKCPYCKQQFKESKEKIDDLKENIVQNNIKLAETEVHIEQLANTINELKSKKSSIEEKLPINSLEELLELKSKKDKLQATLDKLLSEENPYVKNLAEIEEPALLKIKENMKLIDSLDAEIESIEKNIDKFKTEQNLINAQLPFSSIDELIQLKGTHDKLQATLDKLVSEENPYTKTLLEIEEPTGLKIKENEQIIGEIEVKLLLIDEKIAKNKSKVEKIQSELPFSSMSELMQLKGNHDKLKIKLDNLASEKNPYIEPLEELEAIKLEPIDYKIIDDITRNIKHQKFLLKLLTKKDSFVRKELLNKHIPFLNNRLEIYLKMLKLPHLVRFTTEMNAEIFQLGREIEFGNLSNGQKARINLALAFSFRDVLQSMYGYINICILDEVLDSALDSNGVQNAAKMLKMKSNDDGLALYIISHRDEIENMFDKIMTIYFSKGFSSIIL
jgi:DNA repair exonuclease SbcCD ATPase subunit